MFRIVLYARAQAPGPSGLLERLVRGRRGGRVPISSMISSEARTWPPWPFPLPFRLGRVAGAVMGLVVSLLLYTLGLNRPGRPWVDRNITSPLRRRARARRRRRLEFRTGCGRRLPATRGLARSSGPVGAWPRLRPPYRRVYHSISGPRRRLAHSETLKTKENCRARAPQGDHLSVQPCTALSLA